MLPPSCGGGFRLSLPKDSDSRIFDAPAVMRGRNPAKLLPSCRAGTLQPRSEPRAQPHQYHHHEHSIPEWRQIGGYILEEDFIIYLKSVCFWKCTECSSPSHHVFLHYLLFVGLWGSERGSAPACWIELQKEETDGIRRL
jgi:hypothetical protein